MRFKRFTFSLLSPLLGLHYGKNPVSGQRFLHVAPIPFVGIDFEFKPYRNEEALAEQAELVCDVERLKSNLQAALIRVERINAVPGACPRGTPGCIYKDCSPAPGKSCYGGNAPIHVDMDPTEDEWAHYTEPRKSRMGWDLRSPKV